MKLYQSIIASLAMFSGCAQPVLAYPNSTEFCQFVAQVTYTTMELRGQWRTLDAALVATYGALVSMETPVNEYPAILKAVRIGYTAAPGADPQAVAQFQYETCLLTGV